MASCLITRPLPGDALDRLAGAGHEVTVWPQRTPPSAAQLRVAAADVEGLLCLLTNRVDAALLDACPRLRAVSNYAVGFDNVDLEACAARGIPVGFTPDVLTETTADLAFALLLASARRLPEAQAAARAGASSEWEPGWILGHDVVGATLGVVGAGRIGEAVARRAAAFDMTVLRAGRDRADLDDLLRRADFVSLHCPLTDATRGLIDADALHRMRSTAHLVNTARGAVVDTDALVAALRAGEIAGAALDVTEPEPLPSDHPLLAMANAIVIPHLGSATHATRQRMADIAVDNLLAGLEDRPLPFPAGA